jgi:DNA-binding transcriptional ArsR family regulator
MEAILRALSDPSRRRLLDAPRRRDGQTLGELEARFAMTRFGVMKHLRVLEAARLMNAQESRGTVAALMGKNAVAKATLDSSLALHAGSFAWSSHVLVPEMSMVAVLALELSRYDEADSMFAHALAVLEAKIGRDQYWSLPTMGRVADTRALMGRLGEAKGIWTRIYEVHRRHHGDASYPAGTDLLKIAEFEERSGELAQARATCGKALRVLTQAVGPRHPSVIEARYYLRELQRSAEEAARGVKGEATGPGAAPAITTPAVTAPAGATPARPIPKDTPTNHPESLSRG